MKDKTSVLYNISSDSSFFFTAGEKTKILVPSVRLQDVIKEDVLLLKVDVEGWEWSVFKGAIDLIKNFQVENIIMEYSPGE